MELTPAEYVQRQVRVAAFPFERPDRLAAQAGPMFMFGSDYPHPEGIGRPVDTFRAACGVGPEEAPALYGGNAAWLLGR